jgi:hypothetical protein
MKKDKSLIYVSLILLGDFLDQNLITKQFMITPTRMHYKGTTKKPLGGTEYITKTGLWSYDVNMTEKLLMKISSF